MITVYTIAYNEEMILPYFIKWYRERFPNCRIVIHDNESTDDTVKIALENNCEIISFNTNDKFEDAINMNIKNTCWKEAKTPWVIVCDADELLSINEDLLAEENEKGVSIITTQGWNMVNRDDLSDIEKIQFGFKLDSQSKKILFNREKIKETNYDAGAHNMRPIGNVKYSEKVYPLCHFKYLSEDYLVNRYKLLQSRLSETNKKYGWGIHYNTSEENIRQSYKNSKEILTKIL
jgi:glycosyltransferase involved in cell wall biosynthesis